METFENIYLPDHLMADEVGAFMKPGLKVATGGTSGASAYLVRWVREFLLFAHAGGSATQSNAALLATSGAQTRL
jgi:hypothetical protein